MAITRRSFLTGLGAVTVGLLFHRRLDGVLQSLEDDLADEPQVPEQQPSAAEIVVQPQAAFRPERLVVPFSLAPLFLIEDIRIGARSQFAASSPIPAEAFSAIAPNAGLSLDVATPGVEIRFRVRYVGKDPRGARFQAALIGTGRDGGPKRLVLPIDSGCEIVA